MRQYTVITGDTFEIISRKEYGVETNAGLISRANPGAAEPLVAGVELIIPVDPNAPQIISQLSPSDSKNEVLLNIEKQRFRFWKTVSIVRSLDTMDTVEFTAPFEPSNQAFRDTFKPFTYKDIDVIVGGEPLFTGTMLVPAPVVNPISKTVTVGGYSLPGVLNDCTLPASAFPLEFNNQGLKSIATTIAAVFGLSVEFKGNQGPIFERVAIDPKTKAFSFLIKLAQQRNFVISSTQKGKLLFQKSVEPGNPVANLVEGQPPIISITPEFKAQEYYSHITGLAPTAIGSKGSQHTVENSRLKDVIRPHTFKADDTIPGNVKEAAEAKAGYMFANTVSYSVVLSEWRDTQDALWKPNTTITLKAPGVMIYSEYEFIIRTAKFSKNDDSKIAELKLVLPGSFSGQIPESLPWDE